MRYLLDTCVLIWVLAGDHEKITDFMHILNDDRNYIAVSVVSYWEIAIKRALGKLDSPKDVVTVVEETGFVWLNLEIKHIAELEKLPLIHTDPFDRLLISQAKAEDFTFLSVDQTVLRYF